MANSNDPIEALRKSLNASIVAEAAMVEAAKEFKPAELPPAETQRPTQNPAG